LWLVGAGVTLNHEYRMEAYHGEGAQVRRLDAGLQCGH
jgi:hypothetical protein